MSRAVAVVPHTHWDREWYDPFPAFRVRLVEVLSGLLDRIESDPGLTHLLLDGQMALVDDYLAVRPGDASRLARLVAAGRVSIGPWYVLMDEFLVSGETIVRNLQRGMARAADLGGHLPVGYLPDMFGHIGQMPQLLRLAGLDQAVVWRGVPSAIDRSAFWWRSPDGSRVRAEYLPTGYSNGASVPDDPADLLRRLRAQEAQVAGFLGPDRPLLLMNGTDHQAPQPWLAAVVEAANRGQDDYRLAVTGLADYLATAGDDDLPEWTGELRSGARANLLMGVASNRVDVKVAAAVAERSLERVAEPLAALWAPPDSYPAALLDAAWLAVIRNSAHDSICACSADDVCLAVLHRYREATSAAAELAGSVRRAVSGCFAGAGAVVLNLEPTARSGLVELIVAGDAPPGTQALETVPAGRTERRAQGRDLARVLGELTEAGWLDDGRGTSARLDWSPAGVDLRIELDPAAPSDRSLRPVDSVMAEAAAAAGAAPDRPLVVRVERRAAARILAPSGHVPGYGWAALPTDPDRSPEPVRAGATWLDNGLVRVEVDPADGTLDVNGLGGLDRLVDSGDAGDTYNYCPPDGDVVVDRPEAVAVSLAETGPLRGRLVLRRRFTWPARLEDGRRAGAEPTEVTTTVDLHAGEALVRITTSFEHRSRDHRLRALFPLPEPAQGSEAECAFGVARRTLQAEGGPGEAGLATFPSRRWVRAGGLTVTHEGLAEYEVVDGGRTLALTLLRATGVISRPAPATRPNAAGPATPVPGAQLQGPVSVRYGVVVGAADPWRLVEAAWSPLVVVAAAGGGPLPATGTRLRVGGAEVSSLRRAGGALELRAFNPADTATTVELPGRRGVLVDLTGRVLEAWDGGFDLGPWAIATARIDEDAGRRTGTADPGADGSVHPGADGSVHQGADGSVHPGADGSVHQGADGSVDCTPPTPRGTVAQNPGRVDPPR